MIPRNCFGRTLNMQQRGKRGENVWKQFNITNYSQEKCSMEDGSPSHYITCKSVEDPKVIVNLHPEFIAKIFAGSEPTVKVVGIAIIDQAPAEVVVTAEVVPAVPSPKNGKLKGPGIKPIKETKKQRAYEIFGRMYVNADSKAAILSAFQRQLHMSLAGAQTYYYNCMKDKI